MSNTRSTTYSYVWYDGAVKTQASVTGTGAQSAGVTDYTLDAFGLVRSSPTYGGFTGSQSNIYDAADQGIVHAESYNAQSWSDNWYRMGGVNIWHYSNRFGFNAQTGDTNGLGGRYTVRSGCGAMRGITVTGTKTPALCISYRNSELGFSGTARDKAGWPKPTF